MPCALTVRPRAGAPQACDALLAALPVVGSGDYLILYTEENKGATAYLLSLRHHRQPR